MLGASDSQTDLYLPITLVDLIPEDHILKRVNAVLNLSWVRAEVADLYDWRGGRPSIPPEAAVRLMLAGFLLGIVQDRKLMREAQVNLAIRWFTGYPLDQRLPDHSSLTRIRQRWGVERFERIFRKSVEACQAAGLVHGEILHTDATLIRANVSWDSLVTTHVEQVLAENPLPEDAPPPPPSGKPKKRSVTDPDASMATSRKDQRLEPTYKQHTTVDDHAGVIVAVSVTTGEVNEGTRLVEEIVQAAETTGVLPTTVTADGSYAHGVNYERLEMLGIDVVIPPQAMQRRIPERIPARRFRYDAVHQRVRCPGGRLLQRGATTERGTLYYARAADCRRCALRTRCFSASAQHRVLLIPHGYEALLRARRRKERGWDAATRGHYRRHRWQVEGVHGEAKTQHGLRRAVRRGLANVAIQVYLTAACINLKRLTRTMAGAIGKIWSAGQGIRAFRARLADGWPLRWFGNGPILALLPKAA